MYSTLTWQEFVDTYKPIKNKIGKYVDEDSLAFETFGDEVDFVQKADNKYIWTELDGDEGVYIINGYHLVNRIQYYITEVAHNPDKHVEVVVQIDKECHCNDEGEGQDNCDDCDGYGYIAIIPDTREDLIEIYGEEYANATV